MEPTSLTEEFYENLSKTKQRWWISKTKERIDSATLPI